MTQASYNNWKARGVVPHYQKRVNDKIGRKSKWGNKKNMTATTAAIIDTLYAAGPDLTLAPKDMVNDVTRRACAFDKGLLRIIQLDKRGQESCGHDEYHGIAYRLAQSMTIPAQMNDVTSQYNWSPVRIQKRRDDESFYDGWDKVLVRYDTYEEATTGNRQHILDYVKELMEEYVTETDWSEKTMGETHTRDERLDWMLQRWGDDQWVNLLKYKMCDSVYQYKGECAWKDDSTKRCAHHNGRVNETVIMHRADGLSSASTVKFTQYLDEYEGDEVAFVNSLVDDKDVLACIKVCIPKMKTESRDWLVSNYTTSAYKLKDKSLPDIWKNHEYYEVKHGKRGHYQLTWWRDFKQDDDKRRALEEEERALKTDEMRDGLEVNGWKFSVGKLRTIHNQGAESRWRPIEPVYNYKVGDFMFRGKAHAEVFLESIEGHRHMMVGPFMDKGGAALDLSVKPVRVNISLRKDMDPKLFTPRQVVDMRYGNRPFPEGFVYPKVCKHCSEEEEE
jgi:hypothetical protein